VVGGENLTRSKIKSCVYHSDYLSFFYIYIITQKPLFVKRFLKSFLKIF
jgi:hypothetical protein